MGAHGLDWVLHFGACVEKSFAALLEFGFTAGQLQELPPQARLLVSAGAAPTAPPSKRRRRGLPQTRG